jgi:hypothetical protein
LRCKDFLAENPAQICHPISAVNTIVAAWIYPNGSRVCENGVYEQRHLAYLLVSLLPPTLEQASLLTVAPPNGAFP